MELSTPAPDCAVPCGLLVVALELGVDCELGADCELKGGHVWAQLPVQLLVLFVSFIKT